MRNLLGDLKRKCRDYCSSISLRASQTDSSNSSNINKQEYYFIKTPEERAKDAQNSLRQAILSDLEE